MLQPLVICEGHFLDSYDNLITSHFVDLRASKDRLPISTLVKGCRREHALESCETIRISKPAQFREFGEGLIRDPGEMYYSRTLKEYEVVNDPDHLARAHLRDAELNRAGELLKTGIRTTTKSTKRSHKSWKAQTYGKNGWIYCTSIESVSEQEKAKWRKTLPKEYDHISHIYRPREFAKALGVMVAEECGPQGKECPLTFSFGNLEKVRTTHRSQAIYHGPVIYVDDPYTMISEEISEDLRFLLSLFVKSSEYRDQMEYRFTIHAEEEPSEMYVDLKIGQALLGSLQTLSGQSSHTAVSANTHSDEFLGDQVSGTKGDVSNADEDDHEFFQAPNGTQPIASLLDHIKRPSTRVVPYTYNAAELPANWQEIAASYSILSELRRRAQSLPEERRMQMVCAVWYPEPYLRGLCSRYEDPIESYSLDDKNLVVVKLKIPEESKSRAQIAIGPSGTCTYVVWTNRGKVTSVGNATWPVSEGFWQHLEDAGFRCRLDSSVLEHEELTDES